MQRLEDDLVAELLELTDEAAAVAVGVLCLAAIEGVVAEAPART